MFQIKAGRVTLNKSRTLSPKQLSQLSKMSEAEKNRYLLNFMGLTKNRMLVPRVKRLATDSLASKRRNSVAKLMDQLRDIGRDHKPSKRHVGQWVGVEIECIIPKNGQFKCGECCCEYDDDGELIDECRRCSDGIDEGPAHDWLRAQLTAAGVTRCNVKYDGSLVDEEGIGAECTILFNSAYGFEPLERLCKALNKAGCYVNKTCGLHVHLDARHLKPKRVKRIGESIGHALPVIKYLVDKSRHDNTYCRLGVSGIGRNDERYYAVNLTSFPKYGTIEIRLHGGSINATKIQNWINVLQIVGKAKLTSPLTSFQDLIDLNGMNETLVDALEKRITDLHPGVWPRLMPHECSVWPRPVAPIIAESTPIVPINLTPEHFDAIVNAERQGA